MSITLHQIGPQYINSPEAIKLPFELDKRAVHHKDTVSRYEGLVLLAGGLSWIGALVATSAILTAINPALMEGKQPPAFTIAVIALVFAVGVIFRPIMEKAKDHASTIWDRKMKAALPRLTEWFITQGATAETADLCAKHALYNSGQDIRCDENPWHAFQVGSKVTRQGSFVILHRWEPIPGTDLHAEEA